MSSNAEHAISVSLRSQMTVAEQFAYFDHAAVAPLPRASAQAIRDYADQAQAHGDAGWLEWAAQVRDCRNRAAKLIGAKICEIALVPSTTFGINLVAEGFPWQQGDNVVVPKNEFPSNLLPWRNLARLGVEVREVDCGVHGQIEPYMLESRIDGRTRIVALSWVGFASGYRVDVKSVVDMAHSHGCLVSLDAIQGLGAFPLDVRATGVDFASADGHKWMLGPEGAGLFFIKESHLDLLRPIGLGWNSLESDGFDPGSTRLKTSAARYEGGTTNMPGMLGFASSLQVLLEHQADNQEGRFAEAILKNVAEIEALAEQAGLRAHVPERPENRSGIVGLTWLPEDDSTATDVYMQARKFLLDRNIVASVRAGRLRVSTHAYNNSDDIGRLIESLVQFQRSNQT